MQSSLDSGRDESAELNGTLSNGVAFRARKLNFGLSGLPDGF